MRLSSFLLAASALGLASSVAVAQEEEAPPRRGLSDLEETVNQLLEEEAEPSGPRRPEEAEAAEPAAESPAEGAREAEEAPPPPSAAEGAPPASPSEPPPPLTRSEIAAVERLEARGRLLIDIARAGILATQDMLTRISDPDGAGISGWIAEPEGNAMGVTFYADGADGAEAVYRARVLGGRVVSREVFLADDRPPLSLIQARMAAARAATEELDHSPCTDQPFNVLVVPPASPSAPVDVYQTSAPDGPGRFPLGGHFRATVAADGAVSDTRGFTNACVIAEAPSAPAGGPAQPIGITHLLDPTPTEIHLFLSQLVGRPLLVATGDPQRVWLVTPDRIAEVRDSESRGR